MAGKDSPERLPIGWTEQVAAKDGEQLKFYYNVITGQKFYCKADLLNYIELGSPSQVTPQQARVQIESKPKNNLTIMPTEKNNTPDWLPEGWIMELKDKNNGMKYKVYTDPSTGRTFLSKPEILKYLNSDKDTDPMPEQTPMSVESDNNLPMGESIGAETPQKLEESQTPEEESSKSNQKEKSSSHSRQKKVEIVRCAAEGLPQGWIKEIKIERTGKKIRKDPYFTDLESNYVFRSLPDALRYVKTKDRRKCAIKPRKREDLKFLSADTSISEEKQSLDNAAEECTEKEENNAPSSGQPQKTPVSKRKRGRPVAAPLSDSITQQAKKPAEITTDYTKSDGEKVSSAPCRSSPRIAGSKQKSVPEEAAAKGNGVKTEIKDEKNLENLGGSSLDPYLEFAFKTLRGDIPVEANNLAAQGYNHRQRASVNDKLPSFSDYARRKI